MQKYHSLEVSMELYEMQILLKKSQHEILARIARDEGQSLSEIVHEIIDRELRYRQRWQMILAARELRVDYGTNPDLNEFNTLDGDDFR
jgi:hypothetical protein